MPTHTLSPEQIEQYRTDGFVVVESVFTRDDLDSVDRTIRELTDAAIASDDFSSVMELEPDLLDGERVPRRIYNPFEQHGTFRNLATDSRVLDRIESLIGHDIQLQH
ncbi:MAG: hypothetical protein QF785_09935, partial [Phycisphaeraceae bacterium]|nr:hypothetical protein [Phycisphaeraceae bacterium]